MNLINEYYLGKEKLIINSKDLLKNTKCKSKKLTSIKCNLLASKSQHTFSAFDYRKNINSDLGSSNIFLYVNSLFYGSCHDIAFFMCYLLEINGIKSRIVHLSNNQKEMKNRITHVAIEAYYDGVWHFFDPSLNIYFFKKNHKEVLSIEQIKNQKTLIPNKKISLNKLKNNKKNSCYYHKNNEVFKNSYSNYLSLFSKVSDFSLFAKDYSYKKKFMQKYNLSKFYTFRETNFYDENFIIKKTNSNNGIIESNIVRSDKFNNFKNFLYIKKVDDYELNINDFPFFILDLKVLKDKKNSKLLMHINGVEYKLSGNNKWLFADILKKENIYENPIRSIYLISDVKIKKIEVLFLKSKFKLI